MTRLVLVDADMLAGWRRSTPSLAQLHQAVLHLERQHPDATVTVVSDPSLKWALPAAEQAAFEGDIIAGVIVCAPAGAVEGTHGFLDAIAGKAAARGGDVVAVTDRALTDVPLARVTLTGGQWSFALDDASVSPSPGASARRGGRRRRTTAA